MIIKNGRIMNPATGFDQVADLLIEDGKIKAIGNFQDHEAKDIIDAKGMVVAPGLVDIHVHFREPGFTHKEDIQSGSRSAAAGGFTTVVAMANTNPVIDNEETLKEVLEEMSKAEINVYTVAAITKGLKGKELVDMDRLHELGAIGFTDDGIPINNQEIIIKAMEKARDLDLPLSFHEEDPSFIGVPGINEGKISQSLGIKGAPNIAEDLMVARDSMLALEIGAKIDIQHISSGNSVDMIRFIKGLGAKVYAEVTPHHFVLTEDAVLEHGSLAKMNPPLRKKEDLESIIEGLKDNTIEIIATDHAPHTMEEKEAGLVKAPSGIIGLETSLALGLTYLVRKGHLSLMSLLEKMTINPSKLYNLKSGSLNIGADADVLIFDPDQSYLVKDFVSKSSNTPFIGQELYGKIRYTICKGRIVFQD